MKGRQQLKSFVAMACAVVLATAAVLGIRWVNDSRQAAAQIAALAQER